MDAAEEKRKVDAHVILETVSGKLRGALVSRKDAFDGNVVLIRQGADRRFEVLGVDGHVAERSRNNVLGQLTHVGEDHEHHCAEGEEFTWAEAKADVVPVSICSVTLRPEPAPALTKTNAEDGHHDGQILLPFEKWRS